jgi:uncharacterized protein YecT (DUF1311 family)
MGRPLLVLLLFRLRSTRARSRPPATQPARRRTNRNRTSKACLARAADTADARLNQEFSTLQEAVEGAAKDMDVNLTPVRYA